MKKPMKKAAAGLLSACMLFSTICGTVPSASAAKEASSDEELRLWYTQPAGENNPWYSNQETADRYENSYAQANRNGVDVLPIGNGYMGATIYGGVEMEHIQFNEKTLWTGGPDEEKRPDYNYGILSGKETILQEIRDLFAQGKDDEAKALTEQLTGANAAVAEYGFGAYQAFGDLYLDFAAEESQVTNYVRDLDLNTAVSSVAYDAAGTHYTREYFMSYPDNMMVVKLSADKAASMNFDVRMTSAQGGTPVYEGDSIILRGKVADNNLVYESQLKVIPTGGTVRAEGKRLSVQNADSVLLLMTAGTDYANDFPVYRGEDPHDAIAERIVTASGKTYEELKEKHLEDYQNIFSRVKLNLNHTVSDLPTDELLAEYKKGNQNSYLEILLYQYGRYLMVASSREGSLPSNLQGVWNDINTPPWNSDYHFDVNIQMNYWPAYSANMAECATPLVDYVDSLREPGRISAGVYTGIQSDASNPENGYMIQPINNPFGWTAPGHETYWGWAPGCGPWVLQNVWDYYDYTRDTSYLRDKIYPMLKEQAKFWQQYLVYDEVTGTYIDIPSISPEQGWIISSEGATYSLELAWQLFNDTIEASKALGVDEELRAEWQDYKDKLEPLKIGDDGQIKEWAEETTLDSMGAEADHRHLSHLLGLMPGDHISKETPEFLEAAKVSLNNRGDVTYGWAMAHRLNSWARIGDGNRAYELVQALMTHGIQDNLWDAHPPFQIDGNFGYTSGVTEMLMQSHLGYIELLPALPDAWQEGNVQGIVARGNFVLDIDWEKASPTEVKIVSQNGGNCVLRYEDISLSTVTKEDGTPVNTTAVDSDTISFDTTAGESYLVTQMPSTLKNTATPENAAISRLSDGSVEISWDAQDQATGYKVYRSVNYGNYYSIATTKETRFIDEDYDANLSNVSYKLSSIVSGRESKHTERVVLRERVEKPGFVNDDDAAIKYSEGWGYWQGDLCLGGSQHFIENSVPGDNFEMDFTGTGIKVYVSKYPNSGCVDIFIDGIKVGENISLANPSFQGKALGFEKTDLAPGAHTIVVTTSKNGKIAFEGFDVIDEAMIHPESLSVSSVTGSQVIGAENGTLQMKAIAMPAESQTPEISWSVWNPDGSETTAAKIDNYGRLTAGMRNGTVIVKAEAKDGSGLIGEAEIRLSFAQTDESWINDTDPSIQYSTGWEYYQDPSYYQGDCHYVEDYGDQERTLSYTFEGTGIGVYMAINNENSIHGLLDVELDGVPVLTSYNLGGAPSDLKQQKVYETQELTNGTHTIQLRAHARAAGKDQAIFDFFKVFRPSEGLKDRSELHAQLNAAEELQAYLYEESSWERFTQKLEDAVDSMNHSDSTQDSIDAAAAALEEAITSLRPAGPDTEPPTVPSDLKAVGIGTKELTLLWNSSADNRFLKGYLIYQNGEKIAETTQNKLCVTGLQPSTKYSFTISAVDTTGNESPLSSEVIVTTREDINLALAGKPEDLKAEISGDNAHLTWKLTNGQDQVTHFEIYVNGIKQEATENSCELTGLAMNTEYVAKVRSIDRNGNASIPAEIRFKTELVTDEELGALIQKAQALREETYTSGSFAIVTQAVTAALSVWENPDATQEQLAEAKRMLQDAMDELVNISTLKFVLDIAQGHDDAGHVGQLIPTAQEQFNAALKQGWDVYNNPEATEEQVDKAWKTLMNVIHALGFVPGDKTELINLVAEAKAIVLSDYEDGAEKDAFTAALTAADETIADKDAMKLDIDAAYKALAEAMQNLVPKPVAGDKTELKKAIDDATIKNSEMDKYVDDPVAKKAFTDALKAANEMYDKDGATQDEIDKAKQDLLTATAGLRLRADKTNLNDWLEKLKAIDLSQYTAESANVVRAVIARAEALAAKDLGDNQIGEIQAMIAEMENAKDQLVKAPTEPEESDPNDSSKPDDDSKPDEGDSSQDEDSSDGKPADETPKTGDSAPVAALSVLAVASAGAWLLIRRKK